MTSAIESGRFQCSTFVITTKYVSDVHSIVKPIATPYAAASALLDWKPITRMAQPMPSQRLIDGTNTWPLYRCEVCCTSTRGARLSAIACSISVNVPEMSACDAMTVAIVARITIGISAHDGASA